MTVDDENEALKKEIAEIETRLKALGKNPPRKAVRKRPAKKVAPQTKPGMPPTGTVEWEAWQASALQTSGKQANPNMMKIKDILDKQVVKSKGEVTGRIEGLACALGVLRGTSMSIEIRNARNRVKCL